MRAARTPVAAAFVPALARVHVGMSEALRCTVPPPDGVAIFPIKCTCRDLEVQGHSFAIPALPVFVHQDDLCLLSPTLAPTFFYVGKLSVDIPLAFNLARPVKITVSDVLAVLRVGGHGMTPEVKRLNCIECRRLSFAS